MSGSNWFKDMFIDEAKTALNGRQSGAGGGSIVIGESDALKLVVDMDLVTPVASVNGAIYTDENNLVYSL